jgi:hypothetical protein
MFGPVQGWQTIPVIEAMVRGGWDALRQHVHPISDQVFWYDGKAFEHILVDLSPGGPGILPSDRFGYAVNGVVYPQGKAPPRPAGGPRR